MRFLGVGSVFKKEKKKREGRTAARKKDKNLNAGDVRAGNTFDT